MKALRDFARRLPKGSGVRLVLETAQQGFAEHERDYQRELEAARERQSNLKREADAGIDALLKRP